MNCDTLITSEDAFDCKCQEPMHLDEVKWEVTCPYDLEWLENSRNIWVLGLQATKALPPIHINFSDSLSSYKSSVLSQIQVNESQGKNWPWISLFGHCQKAGSNFYLSSTFCWRKSSNQRGQIIQPMKHPNIAFATIDNEKIWLSFSV